MIDLTTLLENPHHPAMDDLSSVLCHVTGNVDRDFFQAEVAYFLGLIPSALRVTIDSQERGKIPVNIYSIALATSGFGKGHSVSVMEGVLSGFRSQFMESVLPNLAENSMFNLAQQIAGAKGTDADTELEAIQKEYNKCGTTPFIFDSGTAPAVKQLRQKLLLAGAGSLNFQMDEIGSNLVANAEVLNVLLELYDLGRVKTKLIKNTSDNERGMDVVGETPANVLMFGTTSKLLDGAKIETEFFDFLETGYARRSIFGIGKPSNITLNQDPAAVYRSLISKQKSNSLAVWSSKLERLADPTLLGKNLQVSDQVGIDLVAYRLHCEKLAAEMSEHEVVRKAEMSHRYFKALKLAGVYAFLDHSDEIRNVNLLQAIRLVEESGRSFQELLRRERNFTRLAKYIASTDGELTHADLVEDLPYYPNGTNPRREMMDLAIAWGIRNHVVVKKTNISGIEFFSGSSLTETDMNALQFSFSEDFAADYTPFQKPLNALPKLLGSPGFHWCNHAFEGDHRAEDNVIPGFNMLVIDVDGGVRLKDAQDMLSKYTYVTSTTKRHSDAVNRFRLILPINYWLELDRDDYKEFMASVFLWLPFSTDESANQRSKKWMTSPNSIVHVNRGTEIVDALPFIPKTKLNQEYVDGIRDLGNLDNLERWFLTQLDAGGQRNIQLHNFARMLKDGGLGYKDIVGKVTGLNAKCASPLDKSELEMTIFKTLAKEFV